MDEEKLIILVSGYKELYDFSDKSYSNQERKNNCWKEISEHMRQPVSACKERWSRLRDNYRKALKFRKSKSGDAAVNTRPYKFEAEMSFLKKYLPDRDQKTNVTEPFTSAVNSPIPSEDGEDDRMGDTVNLSDVEPLTPVSTASNNNTIFPATPTAAPRSAAKRKKVQPENTQPSSVAFVLEKYLQSTTATNSGGNSLNQFFMAMSQTAQSFPPEVQIVVKGKIFNIIQEAELKCLQARNTTQFDNAHSTGIHCNQTVYPQGQCTQHSQDIPHSYPKHMQSLETQPNMSHLNSQHTQRSQNTPPPSHSQNTLASQPHQYSQDIQLSYTQLMPPLGTQPNITYLNLQHTQNSKDTAQHSHQQNRLASQAQIQNMQHFSLQDVQPTYSPRSSSVVGSPELQNDSE